MHRSAAVCFIAIIGFTASAQLLKISGTVTNTGSKPISGAIVMLQGQKLADTTDASGAFSITADDIGVNPVSFTPGAERISLAKGGVVINLTRPSPLMIEMFDIKGHMLRRVLERHALAGEYRFDLSRGSLAAQITILRVSIGQRTSAFRCLPFTNGKQTASSPAASPAADGLKKAQAAVDSLKVVAGGYLIKAVSVASYQESATIALDTAEGQPSFGTFLVTLKNTDVVTSFLGSITDGPTPSAPIWENVMRVGGCRLLKPRNPFCEEDCGGDALCVEDDSCQQYSTPIDVGTVTVNGLANTAGATEFTMKAIGTSKNYQPSATLAFPPFSENDPVTVAVAGSGTIPAFTLSAKGIAPTMVLNDTIKLLDGQPIDLRWTPPQAPGNSTIHVLIDITYHGGTKAKILCDCEDDGELIIPAAMLDKLKTYGLSGFPRIDVVRRSESAMDAASRTKLVIESTITYFLYIPDFFSCNGNADCPNGMTCQSDRKCK